VKILENLLFIKLGGSFITIKEKPFTIDYKALESAVKILRRISNKYKILLGHGGGSFAHPIVSLIKEYGDDKKTIIYCQQATRLLNKIVVDTLLENGLPAIQAQTSMIISYSRERGYEINTTPLEIALNHNIIPVVYGECILDERKVYRVVSTEEVFKLLVEKLKPRQIIFIERVEGVFNKDPLKYKDAELIKEINKDNYKDILGLLSSKSYIDVTGGMYTKVSLAVEIARKHNIPSIIVSGFDVDNVVRAIEGKEFYGTLIHW